MLDLVGGVTVVLTPARALTHEDVLHESGFLEGYHIRFAPHRDRLAVTVTVSVPSGWITAEGVPQLPAARVLRSLSEALEELDRPGR